MVVEDYPEAVVLCDLDCHLSVGLVIDTHVSLIDGVGAVWVEVDPDGVKAPRGATGKCWAAGKSCFPFLWNGAHDGDL